MSESPNSNPTTTKATTEAAADLSQNHDEILDLELGLGALGGLRHSSACDAAERSQRLYDERNHRLHESRMDSLGMKGDKSGESLEAEDMSHQVLIRSPITHHHHYEQPESSEPATPTTAQQPAPPPPKGMSTTAKIATSLGAALLLGPGGVGVASLLGAFDKPEPAASVDSDTIPTVIVRPHEGDK
jgi:hypothetical protein